MIMERRILKMKNLIEMKWYWWFNCGGGTIY
jgi:hypothetical protein